MTNLFRWPPCLYRFGLHVQWIVVSCALTCVLITSALCADPPKSLNINGVSEYFNVRYLPQWRYTGDDGPRGDAEMLMDVYVPPGDGPFPTVIYVHGGGYGGGTKVISNSNRQFVTRLLEEGFVVVSLNYILQKKGIFPQVWWDFHDAVRFLRIHANEYRIHPLRIGAYGLSAGGWLITSATAGNGDLIRAHNDGAVTAVELKQQDWRRRVKDMDHHDNWLRPMRDPSPEYEGVHGGISALSFDFDHHLKYTQPFNVVFQKWAGVGYTPKFWDEVLANRAEGNFEFAYMPWERHKGKAVHVPPFYPQNKREHGKAFAIGRNDQLQPLGEVVLDFFQRRLVVDCRLPEPEIYPVPRVFADAATVSIVGPPGTTIHYTTNGREPTTSSPVYSKPFPINGDTVVKAMAERDGFSDSGINVAVFVRGEVPPQVTGPETLRSAKTGERYEMQFTSNVSNARWLMQGELVPHIPWKQTSTVFPNNMSFDSETGVWSGIPYQPGVYWVQVWVNRGDGTLASHRNYRWEVTGKETPDAQWTQTATKSDQNIELARLVTENGWSRGHLGELHRRFQHRGVKYLVLDVHDPDPVVIVDKQDAKTARECVETVRRRFKSLTDKVVYLRELPQSHNDQE